MRSHFDFGGRILSQKMTGRSFVPTIIFHLFGGPRPTALERATAAAVARRPGSPVSITGSEASSYRRNE